MAISRHPDTFMSPEARLIWLYAFKPKKYDTGDKFCTDIIFNPEQMATPEFAKMKTAANEIAVKHFGAKLQGLIAAEKFISPFWKNERKVDDAGKLLPGYEAGGCYITVKTETAPGVRILKDGMIQPVMNEQDVYGGMWARVSLDLFAYDEKSNGVSFGLKNILKVRDDTPLGSGGRSKAEDDFGAFATAPAGAAAPAGTAGSLF